MNKIIKLLKKYETIMKNGNVFTEGNSFYTEDRVLIGKILP